jgi:hypothetical protein
MLAFSQNVGNETHETLILWFYYVIAWDFATRQRGKHFVKITHVALEFRVESIDRRHDTVID